MTWKTGHTMNIVGALGAIFAFFLLAGCSATSEPSPAGDSESGLNSTRVAIRNDSQYILRTEKQRSEVTSFNKADVLDRIRNDSELSALYQARAWCGEHQRAVIPDLIKLLTDMHHVGLTHPADTIIYERIASGDLQSYGHGGVVDDDLFVVAGRASWLLKEITGQDPGSILMKSSANDRTRLQKTWQEWADSLPKK